MRVLGVDAGINGACALFEPGAPPRPEDFFDIPTLGEGNKREIDYATMRDKVYATRADVAFIEIVNAFIPSTKNEETGENEPGKWGGTSLFRFGGAYYACRAVICCLGIPLRGVGSPEWKAAFGLRGKKKGSGTDDSARQLVLQRYPSTVQILKLKKHQHQAEALLIGAYGARKWRREEENLDIPD